MPFLSALGQRLLQMIPVLIGISLVSFLLVQLSPGDPVRLLLGDRATETAIAQLREQYGLDQPLIPQYFTYLSNLLTGDLGRSIRYQLPVNELILQYLSATVFLVAYAVAVSVPATLLLASIAARYRGRWPDHAIRAFAILGMTFPVFWLALMMARLFGVELGWFPVSGYGQGFVEHLHHLFLPVLSTSAWLVPLLLRNLRAALIKEMDAEYVDASRAKGLPEGYIFRRHVFANSVLPTLNLLGVMIAFLIGSSVVVEIVYAVPGLGSLMVSSVIGRDYYVIQGLTLFYALATLIVTLTIDILSTLIDPRVKL
ncbi:ABC transporter permease [Pseudomonas fluorescens]|uniref:ABC transporter permease n=1 Tax=Pseudomonas fluorescens TaxID=294 RepID=UPI003C1A6890